MKFFFKWKEKYKFCIVSDIWLRIVWLKLNWIENWVYEFLVILGFFYIWFYVIKIYDKLNYYVLGLLVYIIMLVYG